MDERLRIEELARRSDTSVDTIRFYQKRRLLEPPAREGRIGWYGPEHVERLARIRDLQQQGFSLRVIHRVFAGELDAADVPLAAAVAEARHDLPAHDHPLTLTELADRSGAPAPLLEAVVAQGLLPARPVDGEARYTAADAELVAAGLRLLEVGLPLPELLALARRHHDTTVDIARDAVEMFDEHVRRPLRSSDATDDEKARRLVDAFDRLLPAVTAIVANHFRRVLLEVAQEHLEANDVTERLREVAR
ncbi:MAG: MerR family transcriptional regulator [Acidimicrobiia bacterium]